MEGGILDLQFLYKMLAIMVLSSFDNHVSLHLCELGWFLDDASNIDNNDFDGIHNLGLQTLKVKTK